MANQMEKKMENEMETRSYSLNSLKGGLYRESYRGLLWCSASGLGWVLPPPVTVYIGGPIKGYIYITIL